MNLDFYHLLDLQKHLRFVGYDKLNLFYLDKLKAEVSQRIELKKMTVKEK